MHYRNFRKEFERILGKFGILFWNELISGAPVFEFTFYMADERSRNMRRSFQPLLAKHIHTRGQQAEMFTDKRLPSHLSTFSSIFVNQNEKGTALWGIN
jgi:hypothetical protein